MAERRRVAVTGIGAVTPIGIGRERLWEGLRAERSAVPDGHPLRSVACGAATTPREVNDFDANDYLERKKAKRLDRFGHFSIALRQAGRRRRRASISPPRIASASAR